MAFRAEYFLGETFSSLRRNLFMTMAAIMSVALSLLLLGSALLGREIASKNVGAVENQIQVDVFLLDDITPQQSEDLEKLIAGMPEVKTYRYVSKDEAFAEYNKMFEESPALVENVDKTALPASYRIKLRDPETAEAVSGRVTGQPGVEEVRYGGDDVDKLLNFIKIVRNGFLVIVVFIMIAAVLLIANTIRLAIYSRRREVGIMKLVGATNWFVRVPFIFEGMAEGAMGALMAGAVIVASKFFWLDRVQESFPFLPLTVGVDSLARIVAVLIAVGMAVGAVGSGVALRRFLDV